MQRHHLGPEHHRRNRHDSIPPDSTATATATATIAAGMTGRTLADRYRGTLLGLACGDALGTTLEFSRRDAAAPLTTIVGGGPFNLRPGQWTDDTSMALCLAESLIVCRGFDASDQLERYVRWWRDGHLSSTGHCFDIGTTTCRALQAHRDSGGLVGPGDDGSAGNGSLMRLAPVALAWAHDPDAAAEMAGRSSMTTHAAPLAIDACRCYAWLITQALRGASREELQATFAGAPPGPWEKSPARVEIADVVSADWGAKPRESIVSSGYVVASLEAALWCFATTDSLEDACLAAANLGDDADTTAAITGQLAGAFYGVQAIPPSWLATLAERALITDMADGLLGVSEELTQAARTSLPPPPEPPYSYGSRDVQPGYESQGYPPAADHWGRDPWGDDS